MKTIFFIAVIAGSVFSTALGDLANSMNPCDWREFTGSGITYGAVTSTGWSTNNVSIFQYSDKAVKWSSVSGTPAIGSGYWEIVATPIVNYGVVLFMKHGSTPRMWLYKHAEFNGWTGIDGGDVSEGDDGIQVFPNPFNPRVNLRLTRYKVEGKRYRDELKIFSINGKLVKDYSSAICLLPSTRYLHFAWDASQYPSGIYLLKATIGNKTYSKRLLLQK